MSKINAIAEYFTPTNFYDYKIKQSLRFEDGDSPYLNRAVTIENFTISFWAKRGDIKRVFGYGVYTSGSGLLL